jgi:hypothetical protein
MDITKTTHPCLFAAMEHITGANQESYVILEPWDTVAADIEVALTQLTPEELETFAIGEETEMMAVIGEKYDLTTAHVFLNEFFEGLDEN